MHEARHVSRERAVGALMGTFVGDALGMPVERQPWQQIQRDYGEVREMLPARLGRGTYTDDTLLAIVLAESLLANEGRVDPDDLVRRFRDAYDPRRGYGAGMRRLVRWWKRGLPWQEAATRLFDGGSYGNGAAMRVAPVAIVHAGNPPAAYKAALAQARVTHAHPWGQQGAGLQAMAIALALITPREGFDREAFVATLQAALPAEAERFHRALALIPHLWDHWEDRDLVERQLGNGSAAHRSVPTAIFAFTAFWSSFEEAVVYAVSLGHDTDTLGAMTGALAGALHGLQAIPRRWWEALENGPRGRDAVVQLGERLYALAQGHREAP